MAQSSLIFCLRHILAFLGSATTPQKNDDQFYSSILSSHSLSHKHDYVRRNSYGDISESSWQFMMERSNSVSIRLVLGERKDPLNALVKNGGSKRNALLKCAKTRLSAIETSTLQTSGLF